MNSDGPVTGYTISNFPHQKVRLEMITGDWRVTAVRLGLATLIGMALGFEREWRGHDAGLRTHALVALSSAMITVSALLIAEDMRAVGTDSDPLRAVQGLAQAIGFIAGGLIFIRGGDVRNMTTAASLWMAAAVGIAAGAGQVELVAIATVLAMAVLTVIRILKRLIPHREPGSTDAASTSPNRRGGSDALSSAKTDSTSGEV